jgi:hypothetical protein
MDQKSAPTNTRPAAKLRAKRSKATAETVRLFLDVDELPSRYVE